MTIFQFFIENFFSLPASFSAIYALPMGMLQFDEDYAFFAWFPLH